MAFKSSVPKMGKPTPIQVPTPPGMTPKKLKIKATFKGNKGMTKC